MFPIVAFLVPSPYRLHALEQLDSWETAKEGADSSPALLKAFLQSRGNDGTKAVPILIILRQSKNIANKGFWNI